MSSTSQNVRPKSVIEREGCAHHARPLGYGHLIDGGITDIRRTNIRISSKLRGREFCSGSSSGPDKVRVVTPRASATRCASIAIRLKQSGSIRLPRERERHWCRVCGMRSLSHQRLPGAAFWRTIVQWPQCSREGIVHGLCASVPGASPRKQQRGDSAKPSMWLFSSDNASTNVCNRIDE